MRVRDASQAAVVQVVETKNLAKNVAKVLVSGQAILARIGKYLPKDFFSIKLKSTLKAGIRECSQKHCPPLLHFETIYTDKNFEAF